MAANLPHSAPHSASRTAPLILVPNTLDLGEAAEHQCDIRGVLPDQVLLQAAALSHWLAEDAKTTRAFLKRVDAVHPLARPLQDIEITQLPRPAKGRRPEESASTSIGAAIPALLGPALQGTPMGLISEAGLPGVADPGAEVVAAAHEAGIPVTVLAGPSSLTLALAASGLNGQSFAFVGYLPQEAGARQSRIRELEQRSKQLHQTQVLIETPYRNAALAEALLHTLQPSTRLSISSGLTLARAWSRTHRVADWRPQSQALMQALADKVPAVFSFLT